MYKIIGILAILLSLIGCDGNYKNVKLSGYVKSAKDQKPIANAEVVVKCWVYSIEHWESRITEQVLKTNQDGYFETAFEKGEALDISVNADSYNTKEKSLTIKKNKVSLMILLDRK